nr:MULTISPECIES: ABC transporter substrate-binding protein [unclassified Ensifer]
MLAVFDALFDGLVRYGKDDGYVPALASSWDVTPDARIWTFRLRKGLSFHDGTPCDAAAVCQSLIRMARPDKGYTLGALGVWHQYLGDAEIEAVDPQTVAIRLSKPIADLLDILVYGYVVAPSALDRYEAGDTSQPVGTGPYRLVSCEPGHALHLERFGGWHGERPANAELIFRLEPKRETRLGMLISGQAQVANSLDYEASKALEETAEHTRVTSLVPVAVIYLFNAFRGPLTDSRVRRALNLAIDRQALIDRVVSGAAKPLTGFVSPVHFGSLPSEDLRPDLDQAKMLLAEAGFSEGLTIEVDCPTRLPDEAEALTAALAEQLAPIGVTLNVHLHADREAYAHGVRLKQVRDMCVFDSSPLSTFRILAEKIDHRAQGSWWLGFHNAKAEDMLDKGRATVDQHERAEIFENAFHTLQVDPPWLYLYNPLRVTGLSGSWPDWRMRHDCVLDVTRLPDFQSGERAP